LSLLIIDHTSAIDRKNDEVVARSQLSRDQKAIGDEIIAPSMPKPLSDSIVLHGGLGKGLSLSPSASAKQP
jgi:hypothetical protein